MTVKAAFLRSTIFSHYYVFTYIFQYIILNLMTLLLSGIKFRVILQDL